MKINWDFWCEVEKIYLLINKDILNILLIMRRKEFLIYYFIYCLWKIDWYGVIIEVKFIEKFGEVCYICDLEFFNLF